MKSSAKHNNPMVSHYQSLLAQHGDTAEAVQWSDEQTHNARFRILTGIADPLNSVLDVGCGLAHLYRHLKLSGFNGRYCGVDIVPEFIDIANSHMANDDQAHALLSTGSDRLPNGYDYVLLSGVFNNNMDDNRHFMESTLRRMFEVADKGMAFNAMSCHVDFRDPELYYSDPMQVLDFCKKNLGGHPVLRHDYTLRENGFPFEYAVYVYKNPTLA